MDNPKVSKLLKENIKEFSAQYASKKEDPIQFRSTGQLDREGSLSSTGNLMRQHFRDVIGNESIEERIRIMEAHMEMLIHGERDDDRVMIHHLMGGERENRDEPIDLMGNDANNPSFV